MGSFGKENEKLISSSNSKAIGRYFDKRMGQYSMKTTHIA